MLDLWLTSKENGGGMDRLQERELKGGEGRYRRRKKCKQE